MEFKKWLSIENDYQQKNISRFLAEFPELANVTYIVTEKIDGTNFQVAFAPQEPWRYAKRSGFLAEDEKFFGYQAVVAQPHLQEFFARVQEWVDESGLQIRLFGEMFGPGIDSHGIDYGEEKRLLFYGSMADDVLEPFNDFYALMVNLDAEELVVPIYDLVRGLDAVLKFDISGDSWLSEKTGNMIEGVVIQPAYETFVGHDGKTFILKRKNEKFLTGSKTKKERVVDNELVTWLKVFTDEYITDQRIDSIFSQNGPIEEPAQIGKYIQLVLPDAWDEMCGDYDVPQDKQKQIFKAAGSKVAQLLKKRL